MLRKAMLNCKKSFMNFLLVTSIFLTSVFSSYEASVVEVKASAGVAEGWEIFLGILSSLGWFASSSSTGSSYYDQFLEYIGASDSFEEQVDTFMEPILQQLITLSDVPDDSYNLCYTLACGFTHLYDYGLSREDGSVTYRQGLCEYSFISEYTLRLKASWEGFPYVLVVDVDMDVAVKSNKLSVTYYPTVKIYNSDDVENALQSYTLNYLGLLKSLVVDFINNCFTIDSSDADRKYQAYLNNQSRKIVVDSGKDTFKNSIYSIVSETNYKYKSELLSSIASKSENDFIALLPDGYEVFPEKYIVQTYFGTSKPSTYSIIVSEDISDYSLIIDYSDNTVKKVDFNGVTSDIDVIISIFSDVYLSDDSFGGIVYKSGNKIGSLEFDFHIQSYCNDYFSFFFSNDVCYKSYVIGIENTEIYSSYGNFLNDVSYETEWSNGVLFGGDDYASDDSAGIYVPDASWYDNIVSSLAASTSSQDELAAKLLAAQEAYADALADIQDSIDAGNTEQATLLQKILDVILVLPDSILSGVNSDLSSIVLGLTNVQTLLNNLDIAIEEHLPVIQDVADAGAMTVSGINELTDVLTGALDKNGVLGGLGEAVNDVAADVNTTVESLAQIVASVNAIEASTYPAAEEPSPEDDFNFGFFTWLFFLFIILFRIIMLFFHCLQLLFTIHDVEAAPYFLNDHMIQGLNWMRTVNITGELLDITLYDFLFLLVRIVLVFSIVKLVREKVDEL